MVIKILIGEKTVTFGDLDSKSELSLKFSAQPKKNEDSAMTLGDEYPQPICMGMEQLTLNQKQ